ncbi:threonyl-tRNA synthetase editing domain-containing protein [Ignicoccus hospitalis]|uniref:Ser-tRNA(Thr) hydrolase n=1 Tax=Ignicoccus hospitalis (strain KIN4/I / DSM 18386 / JCM 14125) TaxID=453591 RepID=A8A9H7_IGNH4|nr:threonyl-tRNA synthetase editing domain-containing protein [Ignicoccus hospitalis]ABU81579.1 Ser-tRNA(Thr) hydrolase [Ignicoccus hospitalis KIN4/I]HIH90514.1 hypothetical protein [Desulfurococcaceae archaeon]
MKALFIHAKKFCFKPTKKALKSAEELSSKEEVCRENPLVIFLTVEKGDTEELLEKLLEDVRVQFQRVKPSGLVLYPYAHLSNELAPPGEARELLRRACERLGEEFEVVCAPFGWYKEFLLHAHGHPLAELSRRYP